MSFEDAPSDGETDSSSKIRRVKAIEEAEDCVGISRVDANTIVFEGNRAVFPLIDGKTGTLRVSDVLNSI